MANTARINGFRPVRYLNGSPWNGQARMYVIPASDAVDTAVGDVVMAHTTGSDGLRAVQRITNGATSIPIGVIVGIDWASPFNNSLAGGGTNNINLSNLYRAASTKAFVWVCDDPNVIFESSFDSGGTQASVTDVGGNYSIALAATSTTTGASGMEIDVSTIATTQTFPLQLIEMVRRPDNDMTALGAGQRGLVIFNVHQYLSTEGRSVGLA